ncbi:secreted RxLR effector protein 161-like [Apium graveolens]|uniref:secreted RxLR effector protein 161-like n=1 Tax=Apium graveolens TaxID=4045 RepID=UPI003D7AD8A6
MYDIVCTRPDLAHVVNIVNRFMGQPEKELWQVACEEDFCYLPVGSRMSMIGYVFTLGGSFVSWKVTLQPTVILSTTEAEYMALIEAAKEGIWLKGLVCDLGMHHD